MGKYNVIVFHQGRRKERLGKTKIFSSALTYLPRQESTMKISLISLSINIEMYGIRVLSACLKREGHNVDLIFLPRDFTNRYDDETLDGLMEVLEGSELIGISLMTNYYENAIQITEKIKDISTTPVVWGGIHPTLCPEECLNYADVVCVGESEETLIELAGRIENKQPYFDIAGVGFKSEGNININERRALTQNLDSIPFPDYDYKTHYVLYEKKVQLMNDSLWERFTYRSYATMPTRGCPFGCTYCCNNYMNRMYTAGKRVRKRSPENVVEELRIAKNTLPNIEYVQFDDDSFGLCSIEEIKSLSKMYKEEIGLPFTVSGFTPTTISREKISVLVDAGLVKVRMGIQSGSESTKKLYKRKYSNQKVLESAEIINEFKNVLEPPQYDIILDNPWETEKELVESLKFLAKLPVPYELCLFSLTFYPGVELYDLAKKERIIDNDLEDVYRKYYHGCDKKFINKLFFLLGDFAAGGGRIPLWAIDLLTNDFCTKYKLNWIMYGILKIAVLPYRLCWLKRMFARGVKDIQQGNWDRIIRYIKKRGVPVPRFLVQ
jgi:radical SAM superfamily enzyme YgiQ (UPF0313 family)